jgi:deoxyribose-phosphate aldolase
LDVCRARTPAVILKVIIESAALNDVEKVMTCRTCAAVGVDFIKTSTGFHQAGGATADDVSLMKREGGGRLVKASGGIRSAKDAIAMVDAGADRLGCSASVKIVEEFKAMVEQVR